MGDSKGQGDRMNFSLESLFWGFYPITVVFVVFWTGLYKPIIIEYLLFKEMETKADYLVSLFTWIYYLTATFGTIGVIVVYL